MKQIDPVDMDDSGPQKIRVLTVDDHELVSQIPTPLPYQSSYEAGLPGPGGRRQEDCELAISCGRGMQ